MTSKKPAFDEVQQRSATGKAPVLLEIICERVHCVMYDYAIGMVDMVAEAFGDQIEIQTIIRRGNLTNSLRFLSVCRKAGKLLPVPTILINGEVAFTNVPPPDDLKLAIEKHLMKARESQQRKQ